MYASDTHCKHPLKAFPIGLTDSGKTKYKITSYGIDFVSYKKVPGKEKIVTCHVGEPTTVDGWYNVTQFIEIPCGHCLSCRLRYSKEWANRMMLEAKEHESNYFLTLTYDNEHLPECNVLDEPQVDTETGEVFEVSPVHPLVKEDVQKFMKRLRKRFPEQTIRFYACGEYGSQNMRPHYHLILFGFKLPDDDLSMAPGRSKNELGQSYYISKTIADCWKFGIHVICDVSWETCAYTARYVTKKLNGDMADIYSQFGFPREFALMSRKPGIARNYYDLHKDEIYQNDEMFLNCGAKGGKKIKPPKYYDRLYDIDFPEDMAIIKGKRKELAEVNQKERSSLTSLSYLEQLAVEEHSLIQRASILKRERNF